MGITAGVAFLCTLFIVEPGQSRKAIAPAVEIEEPAIGELVGGIEPA